MDICPMCGGKMVGTICAKCGIVDSTCVRCGYGCGHTHSMVYDADCPEKVSVEERFWKDIETDIISDLETNESVDAVEVLNQQNAQIDKLEQKLAFYDELRKQLIEKDRYILNLFTKIEQWCNDNYCSIEDYASMSSDGYYPADKFDAFLESLKEELPQ